MSLIRRVPVVAPNGGKLVLVISGVGDSVLEEDGQYMRESIPLSAIVAVEECPEDVTPAIAMGWDPRIGLPG